MRLVITIAFLLVVSAKEAIGNSAGSSTTTIINDGVESMNQKSLILSVKDNEELPSVVMAIASQASTSICNSFSRQNGSTNLNDIPVHYQCVDDLKPPEHYLSPGSWLRISLFTDTQCQNITSEYTWVTVRSGSCFGSHGRFMYFECADNTSPASLTHFKDPRCRHPMKETVKFGLNECSPTTAPNDSTDENWATMLDQPVMMGKPESVIVKCLNVVERTDSEDNKNEVENASVDVSIKKSNVSPGLVVGMVQVVLLAVLSVNMII